MATATVKAAAVWFSCIHSPVLDFPKPMDEADTDLEAALIADGHLHPQEFVESFEYVCHEGVPALIIVSVSDGKTLQIDEVSPEVIILTGPQQ